MSAFGIEGNQPIKFQLKIKLLKDIDAEKSYWQMDSVGKLDKKYDSLKFNTFFQRKNVFQLNENR